MIFCAQMLVLYLCLRGTPFPGPRHVSRKPQSAIRLQAILRLIRRTLSRIRPWSMRNVVECGVPHATELVYATMLTTRDA